MLASPQAALPFAADTGFQERRPLAWADAGGRGFEIGWDHARNRLVPPVEHLQAGNPIRAGWEAGKQAFGRRALRASPCVREWLRLRTVAWLRGRAFDAVGVTPALLQRLAQPLCPVTREPLALPSGSAATAAGLDRVCPAAGYAVGNLAWMSERALAAKGSRTASELLARAHGLEAEGRGARLDGLDAAEAWRLATLVSFATPLPHGTAALLPLRVLPPPRLRLLNPVQGLQALLTLQFAREGYSQRIAAFAAAVPERETQAAMRTFMHTLLARRIAAGRLAEPLALRHALEDLWADPLVLRRWQRLALALDEARAERMVRTAVRQGLAGPLARWLPPEAATDSWALESKGYAEAATADPVREAARRERRLAATPASPRPISARALGSGTSAG